MKLKPEIKKKIMNTPPSYLLPINKPFCCHADRIVFEVEDISKTNKPQRTYIYSPNGIQLNIPVQALQSQPSTNQDIQVDIDFD
jgi:hypothetical protein